MIYLINSYIPNKVMQNLSYIGEGAVIPNKEIRGSLYSGEIKETLLNHHFLPVDVESYGQISVVTYIMNTEDI
jgi:hypothetical protein